MKVSRIYRNGLLLCILVLPSFGLASVSPGAELSLRLFRALAKQSESENFVFSPFAIRAALGIAAFGAKGNTHKELGKPPELWTQKKDPSYKLVFANRLWVDLKYPLLPDFMEASDKALGVRPWMVDFSKAPDFLSDRINGWVEERTQGKIKNVISYDSINNNSKMLLNSAVYFKGDWVSPFVRNQTSPDSFTSNSGDKFQVDYVHRSGNFLYYKGHDFQILDLPYLDGEIALSILLPNSVKGLGTLENSLKPEALDHWLSELVLKQVEIALPKFEFDSSLELTEILKSFGINDPFDSQRADFSGMTGSRNLYIDRVTHKTSIALTEEGTEALGSAVSVDRSIASTQEDTVPFHANRPFIILIRHRATNSPLFIGHVLRPTESRQSP